jgi:glucose/arabinose dehydrogenase
MFRHSVFACVAVALAALSAAAQQSQRLKTEKAEIIVETAARGLDHPWGLTFLPDGRMLVTERPGRLRIVSADAQLSPPLGGVPRVYARDQGGLLYGFRLIRPGCLAWATSGSLCRV